MHTTTHCQICKKKEALSTYYMDSDSTAECIAILNSCELCENCYDAAEMGRILVEGWTMTHKGLQLVWHKDTSTYYSSSDSE